MQQGIKQQKKIWIAWEKQRRTLELAKCFQCDLFLVIEKGILRYPVSIIKTFCILQKERPDVLFVQNPSMILALFSVSLFRLCFRYRIVVDRHSNFLLTPKKRSFVFEIFFHFLSFVTIRLADFTIVTNPQLATVVDVLGGRSKILPDKIPSLSPSCSKRLIGTKNILVISSFADDEPIDEIIAASAEFLTENIYFYFTGNYDRYHDVDLIQKQKNIILTGFVPEQDFIDLLFAADVVMVLTKMEYTLLCGCYEAIAATKILITSNTKTLRSLFSGAVFVNNDKESIISGVTYSLQENDVIINDIKFLRESIVQSWEIQFDIIFKSIQSLICKD